MIPGYPKVECERHATYEPGYAICRHIVDLGAPVAWIQRAGPDRLGVLLCGLPRRDHPADELLLVCASCAREQAWLNLERSN